MRAAYSPTRNDQARRLFTLWEGFHGHELLIFAGEHEIVSRREALSTIAQDIEATMRSPAAAGARRHPLRVRDRQLLSRQ